MKLPRIGQRRLVYENPRNKVYEVKADFGSFEKTYYPIEFLHRAGIVVPRKTEILLVRQYRLLVNGVSWEIPGGEIEKGEDPAQAAIRECREETGVECRAVEPLVNYMPGTDILYNPTQIFVAGDFRKAENFRPNQTEVVERDWVPLSECIEMIFSGRIVCGLTIIGLLAYARKISEG